MARWLVENGAEYTIQPGIGMRPLPNVLHDAIEVADEELVEVLLDSLGGDAKLGSGAKKIRSRSPAFTAEGNFTVTALYSSVFHQHDSITRMLLDRGADADGPNRLPRLAAVYKDDLNAAQLLFDHGVDVNKRGSNGIAAIHWAASMSSVAMAELLVAHGDDVDQPSETQGMPHTAVYHGLLAQKHEMQTYLIERAGATVHDKFLELATAKERGHLMPILLARPAQIVPLPLKPERLTKACCCRSQFAGSSGGVAEGWRLPGARGQPSALPRHIP